jgi:hypothetical protein
MSVHPYRKWVIGVVVVVLLVGIGVATSLGSVTGGARSSRAVDRSTQHLLKRRYRPPSTISGSGSAVQQADNATIAAANQGKGAQWAEIETLTPPAPVTTTAFPAISYSARQGADTYASAFVTELLKIDFAKESRASLLAWAQSEMAPDTLPGTPSPASTRILYANLNSSPSPVPTPAEWSANAAEGIGWSASGVSETVAPQWSSALATGWVPSDPRMLELDVTGTLTITHNGHRPVSEPFSLQLGLGTAEYHSGYGALSVNNWTEG